MKLVFQRAVVDMMYYFEVELMLDERLPKVLRCLVLSFLKEDPKPWYWPIVPQPSPWDSLTCNDPCEGIELPLFAP